MKSLLFFCSIVASAALLPRSAYADERAPATNRFSLELGGVRHGLVRTVESAEKTPAGAPHLVVVAQDVAASLATLLDAFVQGKPVKKDLRLTSGAVIRKGNDARLVSVKLPALGSGGVADVELAFTVPAITTQPLLSAKEAPPPPASARITGFRLGVAGMPAVEAPKLDAITLTQKPDGTATTGEIAFEVAAGGAPPFVAWQKASSGKPAQHAVDVEYVGGDGNAIFKLRFDRCTPASVRPMGANGTTRITLSCALAGR